MRNKNWSLFNKEELIKNSKFILSILFYFTLFLFDFYYLAKTNNIKLEQIMLVIN